MSGTEREQRILQFWKAVELFSAQRVPRVHTGSRRELVLSIGRATPLPWSEPFRLPDPGNEWRFSAYCGVYRQSRVRAILEKQFGKDPASFDRIGQAESCLFAVQVTATGRPLLQTFVLASSPWATGRLLSVEPETVADTWLSGFETFARQQAQLFSTRFAIQDGDEEGRALNTQPGVEVGRPLSPNDLQAEVERIAEALGTTGALDAREIRLAGRQVNAKYALDNQSDDALNSYFLKDLEQLAAEASRANLSPALSRYLLAQEDVPVADRIDIRTADTRSLDTLWRNTSPSAAPIARWPSPDSQPLYFSQQFAINSALAAFDQGLPLFGVNGPPGTGKTTLLRDLIAAIVVQRAQVLATLTRPENAFAGSSTSWRSERYSRRIFPWRADLLGHGIVVASSNNRAVENITLEIPGQQSIAEDYLPQADYFADFATRVLGNDAWGLLAARLGSKKNRRRFIDQFWFADREAKEPATRAQQGFLFYLNSLRPKPAAWKIAVKRFRDAVQAEALIRKERVCAWQQVEAQEHAAALLATAQSDLQTAVDLISQLASQLQSIETSFAARRSRQAEAVLARRQHLQFKPGLVDAVFTLGSAYRQWHEKDLALTAAIDRHEAELLRRTGERRLLQDRFAASQLQAETVEAHVAELAARLDEENRLLSEWRAQLGAAFPNRSQWLLDAKARELSSPWADARWNAARTQVFLEALHLHRAFIECVPDKIKSNLAGAIDLLRGKTPPTVPAETLRSAWATLFFVVPVLSTTFASFDRLFANCGRESIGWLLIDEAGQVLPQAAAGALWRARRALVAGDPRQLEPIVSLPFTAQQALRRYFQVDEVWLPSETSAQALVDRVSPLGTLVDPENQDEPLWVSSPLRVHRRCENPMFAIANQIAYGGQMVYGTQESASPLPLSRWIDIRSSHPEGHWIPAEGLALEMLLRDLFQAGLQPSNVLLITPFRAVASQLRETASRHGIRQAGTIHVAQGREADVVILVLGGDPLRIGAKEWASERPNLLNVAISRARKRLFIIGNRSDWATLPHFAEAAQLLDDFSRRKSIPVRSGR